MAEYKFDGHTLWNRSGHKVATTDGKSVWDANGHKIGTFDGEDIWDANGHKMGTFDGEKIYSSGTRIGTIADVRRAIEGIGGLSLTALWVLVVR